MVRIFDSNFKLNIINKNIERAYQLNIEKCRRDKLKYLTIFLLIFSLFPTVQISFFFDKFNELSFQLVLLLSYLTTLFLLLLMFITLYSKNARVLQIVSCANYYLLIFLFFNTRFPLLRYLSVELVITNFIQCFENLLRIVIVIFGIFQMDEFFYTNIASIISLWLAYGVVILKENKNLLSNILIILAYTFSIKVVIIVIYFIIRMQKSNFYHNYLEKKTYKFKTILDNLNAGFITFKSNKIKYINKYLTEKFKCNELFNNCLSKNHESKYRII